jgi:hypothetical protein
MLSQATHWTRASRHRPVQKRYKEQRDLDDYSNSMLSRPVHYIFDEDISSDSENGFRNLAQD